MILIFYQICNMSGILSKLAQLHGIVIYRSEDPINPLQEIKFIDKSDFALQ